MTQSLAVTMAGPQRPAWGRRGHPQRVSPSAGTDKLGRQSFTLQGPEKHGAKAARGKANRRPERCRELQGRRAVQEGKLLDPPSGSCWGKAVATDPLGQSVVSPLCRERTPMGQAGGLSVCTHSLEI